MNGIIVIDKPKSRTSFWVVNKIRKITGVKKVGHTGTLDPLATGVLLVCLGEATKAADIFMDGDKVYEVTAKLGERTDTLDSDGEVVDRKDIPRDLINKDNVSKIISKFIGDIEQIPPMYSAIKKDGKPLYKLARKGVSIDRDSRKIKIHSIELLDVEYPFLKFRVHCSKGTYIRTLVDDIGVELGTFAHVTELRRTKSGIFDVKDACSMDGELRVISLDKAISMAVPVVDINNELAVKIAKGYQIDFSDSVSENFAVRSPDKNGENKIVALIKAKKVERVFNYSEWSD